MKCRPLGPLAYGFVLSGGLPSLIHIKIIIIIIEDHLRVEGPILGITEKKVEEALQKMKRGKAPGPSGVTTQLLRYDGETGV